MLVLTPQRAGSHLVLPSVRSLLHASKTPEAVLEVLAFTWGLGFLVSAPCTAKRRLLAHTRLTMLAVDWP